MPKSGKPFEEIGANGYLSPLGRVIHWEQVRNMRTWLVRRRLKRGANMNPKLIAAVVVALLGAAVFVPMFPDFVRYMKIRSM